MPTVTAIPDILRFVAACAMAHPVVREAPASEVVFHAQVESQRRPYSVGINADRGQGLPRASRTFETAAEAAAFTAQAIAYGRSADVGLMGVNLPAHPDAFTSLAQAFDPEANICQGAIILGEAYRQVRQARCIYNSGRPDCRSPTGTNGYPEAVAAAERRLLGDASVIAAATDAGAPPSPAHALDPSIPKWDAYGQARLARNEER